MSTETSLGVDTDINNTQRFYNELNRLMGASIGVIAVRTRELERARATLHQWASMRDFQYWTWDRLNGFQEYLKLPLTIGDGEELPELDIGEEDTTRYMRPHRKISPMTIDLMKAFEELSKRAEIKEERDRVCAVYVAINDMDLSNPGTQQHLRDHVQRSYHRGDRVIMLLSPGTEIPMCLQGDIELIDLLPPSFAELAESFSDFEPQIPANFYFEPTDEDRTMIIQNGLGMTQQEFENAISLGIVDMEAQRKKAVKPAPVTAEDFVRVVRQRKLEILKQTQVLSLVPEASIEDVGGLDLLKEHLELRKLGFTPEAREFGITAPKGFLVVGPPGAGKSLIARATANLLKLPLIKVDITSVFSSLVGSSEGKMRAMLQMLNDMAPCVALFDEIDKTMSGGGGTGDSGVSQRIFGLLLTWMQERSEKNIPVLVVASANDVTRIPPELLRKGRFDAIWAVTLPSANERADIFRIHTKKRGHTLTDTDYKKLANLTPRWVGAEIESVIEEALYLDFQKQNPKLTIESLKKCIDDTTPQAKSFADRINALQQWCETNARAASSSGTFEAEAGAVPTPSVKRRPGTLRAPARRSSRN
jgi:SpoVK/Ycf46/Vps4 family AAA+-type ATPase